MFIRDIADIKDGVTSVLITSEGSDLLTSVQKKLDKNTADDCLYFVDINDQEATILSTLNHISQLAKEAGKDCLVFLKKSSQGLEYISHRSKPEAKYDWLDVAKAFHEQYTNLSPDDSGYWRWGQVVAESGEYLCLDCGYIEDLEAGQIFPVCEVCLAGDPDGPLSIRDGFWEKDLGVLPYLLILNISAKLS